MPCPYVSRRDSRGLSCVCCLPCVCCDLWSEEPTEEVESDEELPVFNGAELVKRPTSPACEVCQCLRRVYIRAI